jgi:hypothetical protein
VASEVPWIPSRCVTLGRLLSTSELNVSPSTQGREMSPYFVAGGKWHCAGHRCGPSLVLSPGPAMGQFQLCPRTWQVPFGCILPLGPEPCSAIAVPRPGGLGTAWPGPLMGRGLPHPRLLSLHPPAPVAAHSRAVPGHRHSTMCYPWHLCPQVAGTWCCLGYLESQRQWGHPKHLAGANSRIKLRVEARLSPS